MGELELVGLHEDGEHLVLSAADGQKYRLRIDEPLRAAVRRDRPQLEQLRVEQAGALPPREIQARIRGGATAQTLADETGLPIEHVRRFEGAVIDERAFVAGQARRTRIGRESSAPTLGDLVTDRLGARGVDLETLAWDTYRTGNEPWTVIARFEVGDESREAHWSFNPQRQSVHALEDEARWLSETEIVDEPIPRRHLAAVRDMVYDIEADGSIRPVLAAVDTAGTRPPEPVKPADATASLLADLNEKRGVRQPVLAPDDDDVDEFEGFGPQQLFDIDSSDHPGFGEPPAAHPAHSRPGEALDATVLPMHSPIPAAEPLVRSPAAAESVPKPTHRASRKQRASVPSWDEIVFGAKPE
jgi:hypothetical protein